MEMERTKEILLHEHSRLLHNFNILKQLLVVYQEKVEHSEAPENLKCLLEKCVVKYDYSPFISDDDSFHSQSEVIECLKLKNGGLHLLIHNLFEDLLDIERRLYDAQLQDTGKVQEKKEPGEDAEDSSTEEENTSEMISKEQQLERLQHEVEEEEQLKMFNEETINGLEEQKNDLEEKLKELECTMKNKSTWSDKTNSYLQEKEKWDVEKKQMESVMNVTNTRLCEAKYNAMDTEEELMKTINLQGIYNKVMKEFLKETQTFSEAIQKTADEIQKPSLTKRFLRLFYPQRKKTEIKIRFLLKERTLATKELDMLESKVRRAQHIQNIFEAILQDQERELGVINDRMTTIDERLQEKQPSLFKRVAGFFCARQRVSEDKILHRHLGQNSKMAEILRKKMEDTKKLQYVYEVLAEKVQDKIGRLYRKVEKINEELRWLNDHPLMAKELVKILS